MTNGTEAAGRGDPAARAALLAIWERARPVLLSRVDRLQTAASSLQAGDHDALLLREAERAAHQIAGSAGTFGYLRAGEIARELEEIFATELSDQQAFGGRAAERVVALRRELKTPARSPVAPVAPPVGAPVGAPTTTGQPGLLIAYPDSPHAQRLADAAAVRGLQGLVATDLEAARQLIHHRSVAAALVDLDLGGEETVSLIAELSRLNPEATTLVTSRTGLFLDRVDTARAGARGFLSATLDDDVLIGAVVDALAVRSRSQPRLLAVDDDPVVLEVLRELFTSAGLALTTLADPLQFWDVLQRTVPDLLLLDVDMPKVTGLDLCRLVRADPRWEALPVLVLTAALGPEAVHQVFAAGADDYVSKPVVGEELLTRVTNRLERVRLYRELAETDPLTGLANRRKFTADFGRLRRMATRYHQPLSFVLLDLDKFKRVNDTYGHAVGDRVLQRIGALLMAHFRGEDLVARWGGEEIALGLYGMSRVDGVAQVASALEALRQERFSTPGQPELRIAFSAGVAMYGADGQDLRELYRAADDVLYRAKALGGNRVLPVGWQQDGAAAVEVVIVDDDRVMSGLLADALTTRGMRCLQLSDGAGAMALLCAPDAPRPSVMILDADLPGLSGLAILDQLEHAGVLAYTKVIMLSAQVDDGAVLAAFEHGAFDHVAKPFSIPVLMQRIRRAHAAA